MRSWSISTLLAPTLAAAVAAKSAADYFVHSLPGAPDGPLLKMHAGHIEVDEEHNGNLFFWHYQNRHIANRQRTVIWLNGGPGCSSMDGALMEVGPYRLKDDHTLEYNDGSWDEFANLLFVDQPVGTGFSYVNTDSYLHELGEMSAQFIVFLEKFFELFPEYERDDLYLAGESYAGMHIPHIATAILERNKKAEKAEQTSWPLKGILIGNGWISPYDQSPSYFEFSKAMGLIEEGTDAYRQIEALNTVCLAALEDPHSKEMVNIGQCEEVLHGITELGVDEGKCVNTYDVRLEDTYPACGMNWPPDLTNITPYLRRQDVRSALHINAAKTAGWTECSGAVSTAFRASHSVPGVQLLPGLLESDVNVLLFSGDQDLICNHLGTETLIHNMKWKGATGFETDPGVWAPRHDWSFEGESAGLYQYARNLTYVLFYNASHMVPFDQPRQSRDMLDRFMGVDIASIGGSPTDSRIDGEKLPQTSVGGHPNSTAAEEQEYKKVKEAENHAYAKSGEAILVIVIIGVSVWGFFIWRSRRSHRGYRGVKNPDNRARSGSGAATRSGPGSVLDRFHNQRSKNADVEAGDFDESELDTLHSPGVGGHENYLVGDDLSDDDEIHRSTSSRRPAAS
ncbi:Pheromone-processing carboxypeptidase kex1 [Penicillium diatomitis]|uniref:Carboxypeptidase n=1 Tax=Penicillium diatomitis TaxID=2819901 RepID=A0A9W9XEK8_9EURO|nr:Pheromone-processing carboxypeptidase kex1 [Penicillium diatomitis]KAJ5489603.1 Pheromone-processing carboxypeptidase kex1 [Penicillium diatomitis]